MSAWRHGDSLAELRSVTAARARGRLGGRRKYLNPDKRALVVSLYEEKKLPVTKICEMMGISKPTLYSYVREVQEASKE